VANNGRYFKDEIFVEKLSQHIRQVRNTHAQTQENLIDNVHLTIGNYETGDKIPTLMSVLKICKHYKISVREFFDVDLFDYPPKQ
jgi:DNA-binding XRE family transcriptional regulator